MILKELLTNFHLFLKKKHVGIDLEIIKTRNRIYFDVKNQIFTHPNSQMNTSGKFFPLKISQSYLKLKGFSLKLSPHSNSN